MKICLLIRRYCWVALLAAGCAVGPNYKRPPIDTPEQFRDASPGTQNPDIGRLQWSDIYREQSLRNLIEVALTNNFDIRIAASRVEQARSVEIQARSQFVPQIGYEATAARGKNEALGTPSGLLEGATTTSYLAAFNAAWEVDLWGRIRRLNEAARAQYLAAEEARHGVWISLIGDVAESFFELLELDEEIAIAQRTTNSFGRSLSIFSERLEGGVASKLETSRAAADLATTAATVPDLQRRIVIKENQINLLLGHNPGPVPRGDATLADVSPPDIPEGLPSELLERRPDIRQSEALARAANAEVGVTVGNFLPRIGLTALYGGVSSELSSITAGSAAVWSVAANITGPVFQGGRLYGQYRQAKALWEERKLEYQQTALTAFQEVANLLISRLKLEDQRLQLARAVVAYREAVEVSTQRYVAGKASYYEVLEAQQRLFPAEIALAQTRLNQLLIAVQLFRALGGGWESDDNSHTRSPKHQ